VRWLGLELPSGFRVNSVAAHALGVCTDAEFGPETNEPAECPVASRVGAISLDLAGFEAPLEGEAFFGTPPERCLPDPPRRLGFRRADKARSPARTGIRRLASDSGILRTAADPDQRPRPEHRGQRRSPCNSTQMWDLSCRKRDRTVVVWSSRLFHPAAHSQLRSRRKLLLRAANWPNRVASPRWSHPTAGREDHDPPPEEDR
jgi:hypothetical protein